MNAEEIGIASVVLGAGRITKDDAIDHSAGIVLNKKSGDYVNEGEVIALLYTNKEDKIADAERTILASVQIGDTSPTIQPLIYKIVK